MGPSDPFAIRLTRAMKRSGKTVRGFAQELDVSPATLQKWKQGAKSPELSRVQQMAALLETSVHELAGELGAPPREFEGIVQTLADPRVAQLVRDAGEVVPDLLGALSEAQTQAEQLGG